MAKMTETDAVNLIAAAAAAAAQLAVLIPTLVDNWQSIKDGLGSDNADELNARVVAAHNDIQALDGKLAALRDA